MMSDHYTDLLDRTDAAEDQQADRDYERGEAVGDEDR